MTKIEGGYGTGATPTLDDLERRSDKRNETTGEWGDAGESDQDANELAPIMDKITYQFDEDGNGVLEAENENGINERAAAERFLNANTEGDSINVGDGDETEGVGTAAGQLTDEDIANYFREDEAFQEKYGSMAFTGFTEDPQSSGGDDGGSSGGSDKQFSGFDHYPGGSDSGGSSGSGSEFDSDQFSADSYQYFMDLLEEFTGGSFLGLDTSEFFQQYAPDESSGSGG